MHDTLTLQVAADVLNVSKSFLVELLENGDIPAHAVEAHQQVRYADVIAYRNRIDAKRRKALDELTAHAQELGMGTDRDKFKLHRPLRRLCALPGPCTTRS